jgi:hypothetical protein
MGSETLIRIVFGAVALVILAIIIKRRRSRSSE